MKQKMIFLVALFAALTAFSTEYYVDASRSDDTGVATNWATAKQTIQAAIGLTSDGDTVLVASGTYPPISIAKDIAVRSLNGPESTIINGAGTQRCVLLSGSVVLDGLTITNGYAGNGAGIFCEWSSDSIITNCIISGNRATIWGGGAWLNHETLNNCTLTGNTANSGAGVVCNYDGVLNNCRLSGNQASEDGGGAMLFCGGQLNNCVLSGNSAMRGGGVFCEDGGEVNNCTISGNSAFTSGGLVCQNGGTINNSIIWGNSGDWVTNVWINGSGESFNYTCSDPIQSGIENMDDDPVFFDMSGGDYHLPVDSPCINAGNNSYVQGVVDVDGCQRVVDTVDIGAVEFQNMIYVSVDVGNDANVGGSWTTAKKTIQAAVDVALDGWTVLVTNGVYDAGGAVVPSYTNSYGDVILNALNNRVFITKAVTVRSVNGPEETVIQGGAMTRCAYLTSGAELTGFTLTGGHAVPGESGHVYRDGQWIDQIGYYDG